MDCPKDEPRFPGPKDGVEEDPNEFVVFPKAGVEDEPKAGVEEPKDEVG